MGQRKGAGQKKAGTPAATRKSAPARTKAKGQGKAAAATKRTRKEGKNAGKKKSLPPPVSYDALADAISFGEPRFAELGELLTKAHPMWTDAIVAATTLWDEENDPMRKMPVQLNCDNGIRPVHRKSIQFDPDRPVLIDAMTWPPNWDFSQLQGARNLHFLNCSVANVDSIEPLSEGLPELRSLNIARLRNVDVSPLGRLTNLKQLDISYTSVTSFEFVSELKTLEVLRAKGGNSPDLSPLSALSQLRVLAIEKHGALSLAPFATLFRLEELEVDCFLSSSEQLDLSPLAGCRRLRTFLLSSGNRLNTSLPPLVGLTEIVTLKVTCLSCDLSPLASFVNVESLDLSYCDSQLPGLDGLKQLRELKMEFSQLATIPALAHLQSLRKLDLRGTRIEQISPLASLVELEELRLEGCNEIQDFEPLSHMKSLRVLNLSMFAEEPPNLQPLSALVNLEYLDLSTCPKLTSEDLEFLKPLTNVRYLSLNNSQGIDDISALGSLSSLTELDIDSLPGVTDLSPLATLPNLKELICAGCTVKKKPFVKQFLKQFAKSLMRDFPEPFGSEVDEEEEDHDDDDDLIDSVLGLMPDLDDMSDFSD